MLFKLFSMVLLIGFAASEPMRYDNYKVVQFTIETEEQLLNMQEFEAKTGGISFFDSPTKTNLKNEAVIPPLKFQEFAEIAASTGMNFKVTEENFQRLLDLERPPRQGKAVAMDWTYYNTLEEIYEWLNELALLYPSRLSLLTIGTTTEGRKIYLVKISSGKPGNRGMFIEANIHAREWISSATATWFINQLLTSTDPAVVDLAENIDWYIIPVMNPDGFSYSHTDERLWRKNRSKHSVICVGVDPNRNFDFHYMESEGASKVKCSEFYAGPTPFSEPEAIALAEFYATISDQIDIYLSFHSIATMLLYPYGHTLEPAPDAELLYDVASHAVAELAKKYGTTYLFGSSREVLYAATGTSVDFMYGIFGTKLAYTYEFRDLVYRFVLLPEFIIPNSEEVLDSILGMVAKAREHGFLQVAA